MKPDPNIPPSRPPDELPGWDYYEHDVISEDQVWGWLDEVGYHARGRLDLTAIIPWIKIGCAAPDGTLIRWEHIKIGKGSVGGQQVFTLNGVGLLDEGTLNDIIYDDVAQVNKWDEGLGATNMGNLLAHCDTPFYGALCPVKRWLYNTPATETAASKIYDCGEIKYILEGHAMRQIGLSEDAAALVVWSYYLAAHRRVRPSGYEDVWFWFWKGYGEWQARSDWK